MSRSHSRGRDTEYSDSLRLRLRLRHSVVNVTVYKGGSALNCNAVSYTRLKIGAKFFAVVLFLTGKPSFDPDSFKTYTQ